MEELCDEDIVSSVLPDKELESCKGDIIDGPALPSINKHLCAIALTIRIVDTRDTLNDLLRRRLQTWHSEIRDDRWRTSKQTTIDTFFKYVSSLHRCTVLFLCMRKRYISATSECLQ